MMKDLKKQLHEGFLGSLSFLKVDIENCPDSLWEKKFGGDYYWQQVFHAIASTAIALQENMETLTFPIPNDLLFMAQTPGFPYIADYKGPHGKDIMYKSFDMLVEHIGTYFDRLNPDDLSKLVDFYGTEMTLFNRIGIMMSHIMYHVGACDAALREHGAQASM